MTSRIVNPAYNYSLLKSISGPIPYVVTAITIPLEFISQNIIEKIISIPQTFLENFILLFFVKSKANQINSQLIELTNNHNIEKYFSIIASNPLICLGIGFLIEIFVIIRKNIIHKSNLENLKDEKIFGNLKSQLISNLQNHYKCLENNENLFLQIIDHPNDLSSTLISMNFDFLDNQIKSLFISYALIKNLNEDEVKTQLESMIGVDSIKHQIQIIKEYTTYFMKMGLLIYKVANNEIDLHYFAQQYSNILVKVAKQKLIGNFNTNIYLILEKIFNDNQVQNSILLDKITKEIDFLKFLLYSTKLKAQNLINKSNDRLNTILDNQIGSYETNIVDECLIPITNFLT